MSVKQEIIEKSTALFFKFGIRSVSMDELASHLGMSKKTIYQYFENKDDLVRQTVMDFLEKDLVITRAIRDRSSNSIEELLLLVRNMVQLLRSVSPTIIYDLQKYYRPVWDEMQNFHKEHDYTLIKENIKRGQANGLYRADIDVNVATRFHMALSFSIVDEEMFPSKTYPKDKLVMELIKHSLHSWVTEKGRAVWQSLEALSSAAAQS
ncbi:MAG: TetR/AcrR family transcriptional regulator [Bacteroidota bacterium]